MIKKLGSLSPGQKGTIKSVSGEADISRRILEMGFVEGVRFEIAYQAPYSGDPIAVKIRGALIALRRNEANLIEVE